MLDRETSEFCSAVLKRYGCTENADEIDEELFSTVFNHSSYANERGMKSNERLEFLGDSIVGFVTAEYLYGEYGGLDEGECSKLKAKVVSTESLAEFSDRLELPDYLRTANRAIFKNNPEKVKANLFEAFTAAVYLFCGMEGARKFVLAFIAPTIVETIESNEITDYKSALYELAQRWRDKVSYRELQRSGPDHCPHFMYALMIGEQVYGIGEGKSKAEAQAYAAREAYKRYAPARRGRNCPNK